jgi:hypothetical protein
LAAVGVATRLVGIDAVVAVNVCGVVAFDVGVVVIVNYGVRASNATVAAPSGITVVARTLFYIKKN